MYFNAEAQARILSRFALLAEPERLPVLGRAEMLFSHSTLFTPVDLKRRHLRARCREAEPPRPPCLSWRSRARETMWIRARSRSLTPRRVRRRAARTDRARRRRHARRRQHAGARASFGISQPGHRPAAAGSRGVVPAGGAAQRARPRHDRAAGGRAQGRALRQPAGDTRYYDISRRTALRRERAAHRLAHRLRGRHARSGCCRASCTHRSRSSIPPTRSCSHQRGAGDHQRGAPVTVEELETTNEELQSHERRTGDHERGAAVHQRGTADDERRDAEPERPTSTRSTRFSNRCSAACSPAVVVLDADFQVKVWNLGARELWGVTSEEAVGVNFLASISGFPSPSCGSRFGTS